MQHWILDLLGPPIPTWHEAMPAAKLLGRDQPEKIPDKGKGVVWCRLHPEESPELVLADIVPRLAGKPLVVLSDMPDEGVIMAALSAGASGCCNSHAAPEVLKQVAMVVSNGGLWVGQALLQQLVGSTSRVLGEQKTRPPRDDWSTLLSEREAEVARLVASGSSNKEIANRLDITERTVKAHLTTIFEKLSLRDRLQLSLRINGLAL